MRGRPTSWSYVPGEIAGIIESWSDNQTRNTKYKKGGDTHHTNEGYLSRTRMIDEDFFKF